jgi:DNA processing protein
VDEETGFWVSFSAFPGIGPVRFALIHSYFGTAKAAWTAPARELHAVGLPQGLVLEFLSFRKKHDIAAYIAKLEHFDVTVVTLRDSRYPALLKEIPDPPFVLYIKGERSIVDLALNRTIAVVGTRNITSYGDEVTRSVTSDLVANGFTIVSGMAYGVDAVAHRTAIAQGGDTIAVLGCGIDIVAPLRNADVYAAIAKGSGVVVSEMPLGMRAQKGLFPVRNRIISGLSLGTLVTEGADDSGALITARYAAEQGREVFAVPGPVTSMYSRGPAKLLKNGAKLVESADDILEELGIARTLKVRPRVAYEGVSEEERHVLSVLADEIVHMDEIVRASGLTTAQVAATISVLEIKGIVKDYGNNIYGRI